MRVWVFIGFILLCFLSVTPCTEGSGAGYWWQMEVEVLVNGESRYGNKRFGFYETYELEIIGLANFERDNGDYILFPDKQKLRRISWQERVCQPGKSDQTSDLSKKIKPTLIINYVVRKRGKFYIDLELSSIVVPTIQSFQPQRIFLPRSAENRGVHPEDEYNKSVQKGSNRVVLLEDRIYRQELVEEKFSWNWLNKKGLWFDSHQVDLTIRIKRFTKNG